MSFYELLHKVVNLLEREGRVSFRALQREFEIDGETLDDIRQELVVVKKIARDIDGKILELIPEKASSSKDEQIAKSTPPKGNDHKNEEPIVSEDHDNHQDDEDTTKRTKNTTKKKHILKWIGAALVLLGVVLPWLTVRYELPVVGRGTLHYTGLNLTQGHLSIAAGIIGAIASIVGNKKPLSRKWLSILILIAGVVIMGFTLEVINGLPKRDFNLQQAIGGIRQNQEIGVFITLIGGLFLFLGALATLLRKKRLLKKANRGNLIFG